VVEVISRESIALVRDRTDIVAVISESLPSLKRYGRVYKALCPFHKEKTPSFHVNPERGFFHCFGCKESGSVIDFLMKHDGYTFPEAVRALAERAGIQLEEDKEPDRDREAAERQKKQRDQLYLANHLAAMFFEQELRKHPLRAFAEEELARRGLSVADDVVQAFRIGYAPPEWEGIAGFLKGQGVSPVAGESVGLLVPRDSSGHYDRFRHRLMFAVMDVQGRVVAFSGRALREHQPPSKPMDPPPKYINSPESPIYTKGAMLFGLYQARHAIRSLERAVLVEGNFDVVSLHARGFANVVAPLGTAFTADQARLLKRFASDVTVCFDGDLAGKKAARAAEGPCAEAGLDATVAVLPEGSDPDDYVRKRGADALKFVLASARGMLEYLIEVDLDEGFKSADLVEKAARVERVAKLLSRQTDPLVRQLAKTHADKAAGRLDLVQDRETFRALEKKFGVRSLPQGGPDPRRARVRPRPPGAEERKAIAGAIIEYPALLEDPEIQGELELLEGVSAKVVAAVAQSLVQSPTQTTEGGKKTLDSTVFLAQIPEAIHPFASERLAAPGHETLSDARTTVIENARKLRKLVLGREADDIAREQYKAGGDFEAALELAKQANERVRLKHGLGTANAAGTSPPSNDEGTERDET
jgi:DNA primase